MISRTDRSLIVVRRVVCSYIDDPADRELDVIAAFLDDVKDAEVPTHPLHRHIESRLKSVVSVRFVFETRGCLVLAKTTHICVSVDAVLRDVCRTCGTTASTGGIGARRPARTAPAAATVYRGARMHQSITTLAGREGLRGPHNDISSTCE